MREKYENMNEGDLKDLKIDEQFMTAFCYSAQSNPSIKWYKDGKEFYRNVFSTSNDRDRVISYNISGTSSLDPQLSGVSYRNVVAIKPFMLTNTECIPY